MNQPLKEEVLQVASVELKDFIKFVYNPVSKTLKAYNSVGEELMSRMPKKMSRIYFQAVIKTKLKESINVVQ